MILKGKQASLTRTEQVLKCSRGKRKMGMGGGGKENNRVKARSPTLNTGTVEKITW